MGTIRAYFRQHRWQRRFTTVLTAAIIGVVVAVFTLPAMRDAITIRDLASRDPATRQKAIATAAWSAQWSEDSLRRLTDAMAGDDDVQFAAIAEALRKIGRFNPRHVNPVFLDRFAAIELADIRSPEVARTVLVPMILEGRNNQYVRRCAAVAARGDQPAIRESAALLAARLGDDELLRKLLADSNTAVVSAAAIDAGLAGRKALAGDIRKIFDNAQSAEVVSATAFALAKLAAAENSQVICDRLAKTTDEPLRDRLLHVMTILNDAPARAAVRQSLAGEPFPSATAMLAAGKLKLPEVESPARAVLTAAGKKDGRVSVQQALAAMQALDAIGSPARREVYDICRNLWTSDVRFGLMLSTAAEMLARQALKDQTGRPNPPGAADCLELLTLAGEFTGPADGSPESQYLERGLPVASAVAATAGWKLSLAMKPDPVARIKAQENVRQATQDENPLIGDVVATRLALRGPADDAFTLGLTMLPAQNAPAGQRVFSQHEQAAGALTLAMTSRTEAQTVQAKQRITERLENSTGRYDLDTTYRCGLLMLGVRENSPAVWEALQLGAFSPRRALAALLWAGDKDAIDWLLWNRQVDDERAISLLVAQGLGEILMQAAPSMPTIDAAAGYDLQLWQIRIMRDDWAIRRGNESGTNSGVVGAEAK